jgi:hypothetical protein
MWIDPIVEELHCVREAHAARFNDDLQAIAADLLRTEQTWPGPKIEPRPPDIRPNDRAVETSGAAAIP